MGIVRIEHRSDGMLYLLIDGEAKEWPPKGTADVYLLDALLSRQRRERLPKTEPSRKQSETAQPGGN